MKRAFRRALHFVRSNGGWRNTLRIAARKIRRCGIGDALSAVRAHSSPVPTNPQRRYRRFIRMHEAEPNREQLAAELSELPAQPLIALIAEAPLTRVDTEDSAAKQIAAFINQQVYKNWEAWVWHEVEGEMQWVAYEPNPNYETSTNQNHAANAVRCVSRSQNKLEASPKHILELTKADFIGRVSLSDKLAPQALAAVAKTANQFPNLDIIYTDEDTIDGKGQRTRPIFKPEWSPDTLRSYHYTGRLTLYHRALVEELGASDFTMENSEYELILRASEKMLATTTDSTPIRIKRVPQVLYHRSLSSSESFDSISTTAPYGIDSRLTTFKESNPDVPMISIIVPTRDNLTDLKLCVTSVRSLTTYGNWELIIVDNGSVETPTHDYLRALAADPRIRVLRQDIPFNFARLNNIAVKESRGQYLLFLNNDTEVLSEDWLQQMLTFASQPHIGAVGARLLYPDGTLQHSGVARVGPGPTHVFQGMPESYEHPRVRLPGNWAAVTAACLMVAADKFAAVGGFDEAFPVGYNDVDLCYALLSRGYFNVLAPSARLIHKEFATRGNDRADAAKRAALEDALRRLDTKWPQFIQDPFYNPNLSDSFPDFMPRN